MDQFALWRRTLSAHNDTLDSAREVLRSSFLGFRNRVALLVQSIGATLPNLTVHDVTHLDGLWRLADEIAGPEYPINPAEAFVLGGTFLIHDAAHVLAAYPDGIAGVKCTLEWKDLIAQRFGGQEPESGSAAERSALFQVLRALHATQARTLAQLEWSVPTGGERVHLLEPFEVREFYADVIGEIAESHHWPTHLVSERMQDRYISTPAFLSPAKWDVDVLKVALLLRVSDAAHVDADRAPWFLFALRQPDALSRTHWRFQAKMAQPRLVKGSELRFTSGSSFSQEERQAWWLAYETASLADRELRDAYNLLRDSGRQVFLAKAVEHISSPEDFATNVRTLGWEPVDVSAKIIDVPGVISKLGGAQLYGDRPEFALRELVQNAADAVRALRALGGLEIHEGEIEIALERDGDATWLHVTDSGIGMSKYVLTEVLLDFGNSLWRSDALRREMPGLASSGFAAVGRFGIGFFSVFMLGRKVSVATRRFRRSSADVTDEWVLEFGGGVSERPALRRPVSPAGLRKPGTKVSVSMSHEVLEHLQSGLWEPRFEEIRLTWPLRRISGKHEDAPSSAIRLSDFLGVVSALCPTIDVKVTVRIASESPIDLIQPNDWLRLSDEQLIARVYARSLSAVADGKLVDLRDSAGRVIGRITHGRSGFAAITHGGIRNGAIPKLAGVVLGHNNVDAVRTSSQPLASSLDWREWAKRWFAQHPSASIHARIDLHPLCPDLDIRVYRIGREELNESDLEQWLSGRKEVTVVDGMPTYEEYDPVASRAFEDYLEMSSEVVVLPATDGSMEQSLGIPKVRYAMKLKSILRRVWGAFEEFDIDDTCVAEVDGVEIARPATVYERRGHL